MNSSATVYSTVCLSTPQCLDDVSCSCKLQAYSPVVTGVACQFRRVTLSAIDDVPGDSNVPSMSRSSLMRPLLFPLALGCFSMVYFFASLVKTVIVSSNFWCHEMPIFADGGSFLFDGFCKKTQVLWNDEHHNSRCPSCLWATFFEQHHFCKSVEGEELRLSLDEVARQCTRVDMQSLLCSTPDIFVEGVRVVHLHLPILNSSAASSEVACHSDSSGRSTSQESL